MISFQAVNAADKSYSNVDSDDVNAVTWGVFRNKEVVQPTVVDH
jgi:methylenetetrahydrofolate reductase (NADPH)